LIASTLDGAKRPDDALATRRPLADRSDRVPDALELVLIGAGLSGQARCDEVG
jgi:hypothetical protein